MKSKKINLPEFLYHYTSLIKYRIIRSSGRLMLTPSNLKHDHVTSIKSRSFSMDIKLVIRLLTNTRTITPLSG